MMFSPILLWSMHAVVVLALLFIVYTWVKSPDTIFFAIKSNLRRWQVSIVLTLTIFVCTLALLVMGGYFFHSFWGLSESTIRSETGHFQIFKKGYELHSKQSPWEYKIEDPFAVLKTIKSDPFLNERITILAPELELSGLLSNGEISTTFLGRAVDPGADRKLSSFGEVVADGEKFIEGDAGVALVGKGLAQTLDTKPGQLLTIMTTGPSSAMAAIDVDVKGISESFSTDYDNFAMKIPIATAWEMIGDTVVDKIIVLLNDTRDEDAVFDHITKLLAKSGYDLEYQRWQDQATYYQSVKRLYTSIFRFFSAVIMIFSLLFVSSILMIMIIQRTYEISLLRSFGSQKLPILRNFITENIILAIVSGIASAALALFVIWIFNFWGIETLPPPGSTRGYVIKIRVWEETAFILQVVEFIFCTVVLSSIYPAYRGCKLNIVESLRKG